LDRSKPESDGFKKLPPDASLFIKDVKIAEGLHPRSIIRIEMKVKCIVKRKQPNKKKGKDENKSIKKQESTIEN